MTIVLNKLTFDNMYSYGANNTLLLDQEPIIQLTAINGCLTGDTIIIDISGKPYTLKEIVEKKLNLEIIGANIDNVTTSSYILDWFYNGIQKIYKIQLDNGNLLFLTNNHKLKTYESWKKLKDIQVNDFIIDTKERIFKQNNINFTPSYNDWKILTYLITEGGLTNYKHKITFTNKDKEIVYKFKQCLYNYNKNIKLNYIVENNYYITFNKNSSLKNRFINDIIENNESIKGYSYQKTFPSSIFTVSKKILNEIFAIYLETDGSIEKQDIISFSTSSIKLGYQLLWLLKYRYNIQCNSRIRKTTHKDNMEIIISKLDQIQIFGKQIIPYVVGYKKQKLLKLLNKKSSSTSYTQNLIPKYLIKKIRIGKNYGTPHISNNVKKAWESLNNTKHGITLKNYNILTEANYIEKIKNIDNIKFLRIKKIEYIGELPTYDITTSTQNFIANDILVHNSGKTSLALILQELLFSKNIKSIKKGDILHRYLPVDSWKGTISFTNTDNNTIYKVIVTRKNNSSKVTLLENNKDISEHKVPDTYKKIKEILGMDFEIFSQLTYQSSVNLLNFIKATDANRKKFLINLFNLQKYIDIGDKIKILTNSKEKELLLLQGELNSINKFLSETIIPAEKLNIQKEKEIPQELLSKKQNLEKEIQEYNTLCEKIQLNNLRKKELDNLIFDINLEKPDKKIIEKIFIDQMKVSENIGATKRQIKKEKELLSNLNLSDTCYTCGQKIDNTVALKLKEKLEFSLSNTLSFTLQKFEQEKIELDKQEKQEIEIQKLYKNNQANIQKFEHLSQLINNTLPLEYPNYDSIQNELNKLDILLSQIIKEKTEIENNNAQAIIYNTKIDTLIQQKREYLAKQHLLSADIDKLQNKIENLLILKKAFSPSGIVAYKLENLTKELENSINNYLLELTDGKFQVVFRLTKDKLNIIIIALGKEVPIETISGGEFGRVQVGILLAIRSILSKLGDNNINLLFLDEITGTLDEAGKEALIEVLQKEKDLNVFLISHDYNHPLIPKIIINKKDEVSSIETSL